MATSTLHKVLFTYTEESVPPRCRKPRPVMFDGEIDVGIDRVDGLEAPVAIQSRGFRGFGEDRRPFAVEYRWWRNKLWTAVRLRGTVPDGYSARGTDWDHPEFPDVLDVRTRAAYPWDSPCGVSYYTAHSREAIERTIRECVEDNLVVDGVWHKTAGEPRYVVQTFGLGRNHGGTAVFADGGYNSNIPHHRYFSLFHRDEALALATRIATERGDDKSLPMTVNGDPEFEILLPEAIQVRPSEQHGNGDPFLNSLDAITSTCGGSPIGGLMAAVLAVSRPS